MKTLKYKLLATTLFLASFAFAANVIKIQPVEKSTANVIELTETNHVLLRGPVSDQSVAATLSELTRLLSKRKNDSDLYLVLDTPGGSVGDGLRIYEFLKGYKNVHTITLNSYSMGAILVELIDGQRLMTETGTLMFHRMKAMMSNYATTEQIQSRAAYYAAIELLIEDKIADRVGNSQPEIHKLHDNELYLIGPEAVERGYADKVVGVKCSSALLKKKKIEIVQPLPFLPPEEVEVSACPLL
jgi:ATP-dependent Clp protease protease subunit